MVQPKTFSGLHHHRFKATGRRGLTTPLSNRQNNQKREDKDKWLRLARMRKLR